MKKVQHFEEIAFTYDNEEDRELHVQEMEKKGWESSGQVKRVKEGHHLMNLTKDSHEWYARFYRNLNGE